MTTAQKAEAIGRSLGKFQDAAGQMDPEGIVGSAVNMTPHVLPMMRKGRGVLATAEHLQSAGVPMPIKIAGKIPGPTSLLGRVKGKADEARNLVEAVNTLAGGGKKLIETPKAVTELTKRVDDMSGEISKRVGQVKQLRTDLSNKAKELETSVREHAQTRTMMDKYKSDLAATNKQLGRVKQQQQNLGKLHESVAKSEQKLRTALPVAAAATGAAGIGGGVLIGRASKPSAPKSPKPGMLKAAAKKDYGPGGKWIYDRAHGMMGEMKKRYGEKEGERIAYAVATQQAHAVRKSPKGFRTPEGVREARLKHDAVRRAPKELRKTAKVIRVTRALSGGGHAPLTVDASKMVVNHPKGLLGRLAQDVDLHALYGGVPGALLGGGAGAGVGAISAPEGERGRGALLGAAKGALLGALIGTGTSAGLTNIPKRTPAYAESVIPVAWGSAAAGGAGGGLQEGLTRRVKRGKEKSASVWPEPMSRLAAQAAAELALQSETPLDPYLEKSAISAQPIVSGAKWLGKGLAAPFSSKAWQAATLGQKALIPGTGAAVVTGAGLSHSNEITKNVRAREAALGRPMTRMERARTSWNTPMSRQHQRIVTGGVSRLWGQ